GLANFVLQPLNLFLGYMLFEGLVRCVGALAVHEYLPTVPLYAVSKIHEGIEQVIRRHRLGPPIIDMIQPSHDGTYDIRVLSCRPKPEWNPGISVRFRGEFYVLAGEERGFAPRPFIYQLRKSPPGRLITVVCDYRLDGPVTR